jgi:hypothetical protein
VVARQRRRVPGLGPRAQHESGQRPGVRPVRGGRLPREDGGQVRDVAGDREDSGGRVEDLEVWESLGGVGR